MRRLVRFAAAAATVLLSGPRVRLRTAGHDAGRRHDRGIVAGRGRLFFKEDFDDGVVVGIDRTALGLAFL